MIKQKNKFNSKLKLKYYDTRPYQQLVVPNLNFYITHYYIIAPLQDYHCSVPLDLTVTLSIWDS